MSAVSCRAALEFALNAISPALSSAWENDAFTPVTGTPFQRVNLLLARPINEEDGARHIEHGFMQVTLCYPQNAGPSAAATRAELIRDTFYRGAGFTSGSVTVRIDATPEIMPGYIDAAIARYCVPVRVRFFAPIEG